LASGQRCSGEGTSVDEQQCAGDGALGGEPRCTADETDWLQMASAVVQRPGSGVGSAAGGAHVISAAGDDMGEHQPAAATAYSGVSLRARLQGGRRATPHTAGSPSRSRRSRRSYFGCDEEGGVPYFGCDEEGGVPYFGCETEGGVPYFGCETEGGVLAWADGSHDDLCSGGRARAEEVEVSGREGSAGGSGRGGGGLVAPAAASPTAASCAAETDPRLLAFELAQVIRALERILTDTAAIDAAGLPAPGGRCGAKGVPDVQRSPIHTRQQSIHTSRHSACLGGRSGGAWGPSGVDKCAPQGGGGSCGGFGGRSGSGGPAGSPVGGATPTRSSRQDAHRSSGGGAVWWQAAHALLSRARAVLLHALSSTSNASCPAAHASANKREYPREFSRAGGADHSSSDCGSRRFWRHELRRMHAAGQVAATNTAAL
jgi:hypothetical protein